MASSSAQTQTPRRIPGAPPNIFHEGAGFSYSTDTVTPLASSSTSAPPPPPPPTTSSTTVEEDPWAWDFTSTKKKKKKVKFTPNTTFDWGFDTDRPKPTSTSSSKSKGKAIAHPLDNDAISTTAVYGDEFTPVFGKPFGFGWGKGNESLVILENAMNGKGKGKGKEKEGVVKTKKKTSLNPYEDLLADADDELDLYAEGKGKLKLVTFGKSSNDTPPENIYSPSSSTSKPTETSSWRDDIPSSEPPLPFPPPSTPPTTCTVCLEDFTPRTKPPAWISLTCMHTPSVCTTCLTTSIKSDLESKMWNKIQCPECGVHLIYDDVRRLADAVTFARYEILSFRSAISQDPNFIWCRTCSFGQLHESGSSSPILRCLNCNSLSCFNHQSPWHKGMTCSEYDLFLSDPDNFISSVDAANLELQKQEEEQVKREEVHRKRLEEQKRQLERHREEKEKERKEQREEAKRKRGEWEREEMKRKVKEEKASLKIVEKTTKRCPGCQWAIEKNEGCAHMTCTQCRHQFCWNCMKKWFGHGSRC